ncbi:MAG: DUF6443 domain-containing protein, partial [Prevotellaceae bacterium]|nr:DUF6443 domain-containing protein [Prevotellaceae bacterium]
MKKYLITLILSVLFCGNGFSQDHLNLPHVSIISPSVIDASYEGGDFEVSLGYSSQFTNYVDLLVELINDRLGGAYNITVMQGIGYQKFIFRISQNGYNSTSVILTGGSGGSMTLNQAACPPPSPITGDVTPNSNWIVTTAYRSADTTQFNRNITYYDAFGLPEQAIQVKASPNMKNIVQPVAYDNMRRSDAKAYLPYASANSNAQRESGAPDKQKQFYQNRFNASDAEYAYIEKVYLPGKPVSKQYNAGSAYRDQEKYTGYAYEANAANEVYLLNVNAATGALTVAGYYATGTLFKNSVTDEDGIKVSTYTDKSGNTVLTRAKDNGNQNVDTYYAYDSKGQLRWTVSPEGSAALVNGSAYQTTSDLAGKYCYTYKYDGRGNVIERQLPGKDAEYMVYDKGGRLVMFQDGVMRAQNQWIYNVYDDVNNLTDKSLVQGIMTREQIQAKYYEPAFKNNYMSLVGVHNIYRPFGASYFTTVHLISSTRYTGKKYYVRNELPEGIYLRVNTRLWNKPVHPGLPMLPTESADNEADYLDESIASIDVAGKIIRDTFTIIPPIIIKPPVVVIPPDPDPDPDPENPCWACDPNSLYTTHGYDLITGEATVSIKDTYLRYTDPNNSNVKYYEIPPAYMDIAECLTTCSSGCTLFEGIPGGAQTTLWATPASLAFDPVAGVCTAADRETVNVKNMKAYEKVKILTPGGDFVERAFYYDKYGRLIQTVEKNHLGQISRYSTKYDFAGNILVQHESHKTGSGAADTRLTAFTYDHRGRMLTETTTVNGDAGSTASVSYVYDELGQPMKKIFGDNTIVETKTYNIQGQLTRKQAKAGADNIFDLQMKYHDATKAAKSYAGNITELSWQHRSEAASTYAYTYDRLKRLTSSMRYEGTGATPLAAFTEQGITYDRNGNILTLKRYGAAGLDNDLEYSYSGNKLTGLTGVAADAYAYDANGSMTHDGRRGFDVEYNLIDLPYLIKEISIHRATQYTYLADGTKLGVERDDIVNFTHNISGFDYLGSFVYGSEQRVRTFESTAFAGGRITKTTGGYEVTYFITDHLGSTRAVVNSSGTVIGANDYYPFGRLWESADIQAPTTRYLFSGKELQTTGGINYMDFGSRMYDDFLGRWFTHDPQSYRRPWESPYGYCGGNPVVRIDPNGEFFWVAIGIAAAVFAVGNTVVHAIRGDIHNFGDFFKYMGQGALAGALLGATMQIPIIGNILQGYAMAQLGIGLGGTIMGGISHGWKGLANGAKTFLGNFYIDENASFFNGVWQGYSRHTWEFPQTMVGHAYTMGRNIDRHVSRVDYLGGATFATIENAGYNDGVTIGSFININIDHEITGNFDSYVISNPLYMHEYGHYLDSRRNGPGYLVNIGLPSLRS